MSTEEPVVPSTWPNDFFGLSFIPIFERLGKFENTNQDLEHLITLLNQPFGAKILDVPCGFGRFSSLLHKRGFDVIGIDLSEHLLDHAKSYNPGPTYIRTDMRNPPSGPFDVILNLWTSFGYFDQREDDRTALKAWYQELRTGGTIVMEISDLERSQKENQKKESITYKRREKNEVIEEAWISWSTRMATIAYSLGPHKILGKTYIYSKAELISLFNDVGFRSIETFGGFDRRPKNPKDRLVILARK